MRKIERRNFLKTIGATASFAGALPLLGANDSQLRMRIGFMTDTHIRTDLKSCDRLKAALQLFKSKNCDIVINGGDICDEFFPTGYAAYRETVESVYGNDLNRPKEVYVYAWHDCYRFRKDIPRDDCSKHCEEAFAEVKRLLKDPNPGCFYSFDFKGYAFVVVPQLIGSPGMPKKADYLALVKEACARHPGKPVFLCDHWPPRCTTDRSEHHGGHLSRRDLAAFPQLVMLTGHTHGYLASDSFIAQNEFTVLNGSCLQLSSPSLAGDQPSERQRQYCVMTLDVFDDRITVHRWDVRDGLEIRPSNPWEIELPYDPKTAKWNHDRLAREFPPDLFSPEAKAVVKRTTSKRGKMLVPGYEISFPSLGADTKKYRITAECRKAGKWVACGWCEAQGEYWLRKHERHGLIRFFYPEDRLESDSDTRFCVVPENHFRIRGLPIRSQTVSVPAVAGKVIFETTHPETELSYVRVKDGEKIPMDADGFHVPNVTQHGALELPKGIFADVGRYRVVADIEMRQPPDAWRLRLELDDAKTGKMLSGRFISPYGCPGAQRWVFSFEKKDAADCDSCNIGFTWGAISKMRFIAVKVIKLEDVK